MRRLLLALVLAVTGIAALAPPAQAVLAPVAVSYTHLTLPTIYSV